MAKNAGRNIIIGAGVLALLFAVSSTARNAAVTIFDTLKSLFTTDQIEMLYGAYRALKAVGFAGVSLKLALAQVMFETGVFETTSAVAVQDNNFTGIVYINNPAIQANATQGLPMPGTPYHYAHFLTVSDWANDYKRIVNDPPYYPIEYAGDPATFAQLLSQNGYYTGSETSYAAGLTHYWDMLSSVGL